MVAVPLGICSTAPTVVARRSPRAALRSRLFRGLTFPLLKGSGRCPKWFCLASFRRLERRRLVTQRIVSAAFSKAVFDPVLDVLTNAVRLLNAQSIRCSDPCAARVAGFEAYRQIYLNGAHHLSKLS